LSRPGVGGIKRRTATSAAIIKALHDRKPKYHI
jgi:hypothetical protein